MAEIEVGDTITIAGVYHKRTFWEWLTRKTKVLRAYKVEAKS